MLPETTRAEPMADDGTVTNEADDGTVTNEADVGLPPLSRTRRGIWAYYRLQFLADGYPGRRTGEILSPHPIYGTYVVTDYLGSYSRTRDPVYLAAARQVADAALSRMDALEDSLVFMYEPGTGISSMPHRFYSGLTQARYLAAFGKLAAATGDERYREANHAILRSLLVPAERGGVARTTPHGGAVIEEYAHDVPDYTLNGWTTATLLVADYAAESQDADAVQLTADSARGIRDVLPLYDVPELANSRYRLGGLATIRLRITGTAARVRSMAVHIPGQGTFPIQDDVPAGDGRSRVIRGLGEGGEVQPLVAVDAFLSRITWPTPNRLLLHLDAAEPGALTASIGQGDYQPVSKRLRPTSFSPFAKVQLTAGENALSLAIPWDQAELIAYPTNFGKRYEGRQHNAYHFIHIDTLSRLALLTDDEMFTYFAARWEQYVKRWPSMPVYAEAGVVLHQYKSAAKASANG